jgi:SpoIVB peptidase S55
MKRLTFSLVLAAFAAAGLLASPRQIPAFLPVDEVQPGMVGVGRTVYEGEQLAEFRATVVGVLRNVMGPRRDLILARLEGGPLANTGVIAGMSGSPVYVDGRLIGAVSYALGSFPKEPLAGITPIREMLDAVDRGGPRTPARDLALAWPAAPDQVFAALGRFAERAAMPVGGLFGEARLDGPASLADLAPSLRPIRAAMVFSGFDPAVDRQVRTVLAPSGAAAQAPAPDARPADDGRPLRPGDPVGMSLIRGDMEMGATGTVTYVDGSRVYGFGHPFLNLGASGFAMTRPHVYTVLPSLDASMKIATLGPVIGAMNQDRATAVGGILGPPPRELQITLTLKSERIPDRRFTFRVMQDPTLTPLFAYVAVLNTLVAYERQTGVLSIATSGRLSLGPDGDVAIDDFFSGDGAVASAAAAVAAPVGAALANTFREVTPEMLDLELRTSEQQQTATIERVWLDTTRPTPGGTNTVQVLLRDYRGGTETVSIPVEMPAAPEGPLTLLVSDASTLVSLEQRDLLPGHPMDWPALVAELNKARRNNRIYVRLIRQSPGTVVAGETLPALPASVRSAFDADKSVPTAPLMKTVVGAWEHRMDRAVIGSRQLTITLTSRR